MDRLIDDAQTDWDAAENQATAEREQRDDQAEPTTLDHAGATDSPTARSARD